MRIMSVCAIGFAVAFAMAAVASAATIDDMVGTWNLICKTKLTVHGFYIGTNRTEPAIVDMPFTQGPPGSNSGYFTLHDPDGVHAYTGSFNLSPRGKKLTMELDDTGRQEFLEMLTGRIQRAESKKGLTLQNIAVSLNKKGVSFSSFEIANKKNQPTKGKLSAQGKVEADVWDGTTPLGRKKRDFSFGLTMQFINKETPSIVEIGTLAISHETFVPFFTMGHDLEYLPYGGIGVIQTGSEWNASIEFVNVSEGKYVPRYDGYGILTLDVIGVGPVQGYCEIEWGLDIDQLSVTSGGHNKATISMSSNSGCEHIAVDRFIANPNYEFDPWHPCAGSVDCENIITVYVDDIEPASDLDFQVCDEDIGQDCEVSPFGIFPDLPNPPETVWPHPDEWETEEMLIQTESHGDLVGYLVVKPQARPTVWEVRFQDEEDHVEVIYLRISNTSTVVIDTK